MDEIGLSTFSLSRLTKRQSVCTVKAESDISGNVEHPPSNLITSSLLISLWHNTRSAKVWKLGFLENLGSDLSVIQSTAFTWNQRSEPCKYGPHFQHQSPEPDYFSFCCIIQTDNEIAVWQNKMGKIFFDLHCSPTFRRRASAVTGYVFAWFTFVSPRDDHKPTSFY